MLEVAALAILVPILLLVGLIGLFVGGALLALKLVLWLVLLPFRLLFALLVLPLLLLKALVGGVVMLVLAPVMALAGIVALVAMAAAVVVPLLPLLLIGLAVWVVVRLSGAAPATTRV